MVFSAFSRLSVLLFSALFIVVPAHADSPKTPFKVCYEDQVQPPYYYGAGTAIPRDKPGLYVDMSRLLAARLNLSMMYVRAPWKRCLVLLEKNYVDAVYGASYKKERLSMGRYPMRDDAVDESRRIATKSYALYRNKNAKVDWNGTKLSTMGDPIGAPLGYSIVSFLEGQGAAVETRWGATKGLHLVSIGRLQSYATLELTADAVIRSKPSRYRNVVKVDPLLQTKSYFVMLGHRFYRQAPDLSEKIWTEISRIREQDFPNLIRNYIEVEDS